MRSMHNFYKHEDPAAWIISRAAYRQDLGQIMILKMSGGAIQYRGVTMLKV